MVHVRFLFQQQNEKFNSKQNHFFMTFTRLHNVYGIVFIAVAHFAFNERVCVFAFHWNECSGHIFGAGVDVFCFCVRTNLMDFTC